MWCISFTFASGLNGRFCRRSFDRSELYRCIDNELQWCIHDPYTEIGPERSRFRIGFGSNGTFHYGCRYAERCKIFECIFSR